MGRRHLLSLPDEPLPIDGGGVPYVEVPLVAGDKSTTLLNTYERASGRTIDLTLYPAFSTTKTRTLLFEGTIESSNAGVVTQVRLFDVTAAVEITGSVVSNVGAGDKTLPTHFSLVVPGGTSPGTLRDDVVHTYEVQVQMTNGVAGINTAIVSNARLLIRYDALVIVADSTLTAVLT